MHSYLQQLAKQMVRKAGDRIQDYTFVFPNRRAGLFFRHYLAGEMQHPIWAPEILTINDCFAALSPLHTVDQLTLLIRLYHVYREQTHSDETLGDWIYWGKMLLQDFSEVDNHLTPNVRELFTTIRDLRMVDEQFGYLSDRQRDAISTFWQEVKPQGKETTERFMHLWDCLWPVYSAFREELLRDGLAYEGLLHRHLIENWDTLSPGRLRKHYVFIGFNALTGSEEQLLVLLRKAGLAEFHFDYTDRKVADPENRTSLFIERNKELFGLTDIGTREDEEKDIRLISIPSTTGEAHEVWRVLNDMFPKGQPHEPLTRTAVVLPDERMLLPILNCLPEQIDKVNVTMGYPLRTTPAYALLGLLRMLLQRQTEAGYYHQDVVNLLNHRFVRKYAMEESRALLQQIEQQNLIYVPEQVIPEHPLLDSLFRSPKQQTQTLDYVRDILRQVSDDPTEELYTIHTALNQIEQTLRQYPVAVEAQELFVLMEMLLDDRTIPYAGEPLEGLQIMGVLETRALDFDRLIITGFNDTLYPGSSTGHSFIPYTLRRGFGLPTPERQDAIFAYNFYRMLSYAREVVFICNSDTENVGEPSRYLSQLRYQYGMTIRHEIVQPDSSTTIREPLAIRKGEHVLEQLNAYFDPKGRRGLSASAIKDYLKCPAKFYWQYIARLKAPKEVTEETDNRQLGTCFHEILEHLYQPLQGKMVERTDIEHMLAQLDAEWGTMPETREIQDDELAMTVLRRYIDLQLERDKGLTPFRYLRAEMHCEGVLQLEDGRQIKLTGNIDRVEEKDGVIRLADYKTGKAKPVIGKEENLFTTDSNYMRDAAMQTIFYSLLYPNPEGRPIAPQIYGLRLGSNESTAVRMKEEDDQLNLEALKDTFTDNVRRIATEILNPELAFTSEYEPERKCTYCDFCALCR